MKELLLYDTFNQDKRAFKPLEDNHFRIYCCGPTTYDMSHIGHARAAVAPDVLVRFLREEGYKVTYVRNITDVDDKIIARAQENGEEPAVLSARYAEEYQRDLDALGCLVPEVRPKVTEHIPEIVSLVERLVESGHAYEVEGDVYYRVEKFDAYGLLSKRKLEDLIAGARVEVNSKKETPCDFALWKAAKPGEPQWESPWGPGRPGWHIECSAMSERHLGVTYDLHAGGRDLIFPHHENEIAQSQGAHGEGTFARHWFHNGFVNFAGEKMSKSLGNFFTIREVTQLYHPGVLRYFLLSVHYRSGLGFDVEVRCSSCNETMDKDAQAALQCSSCGEATTAEALKTRVRFPGLEEADDRVAYVYETIVGAQEVLARTPAPDDGGEIQPEMAAARPAFLAAMRDDLNTAGALGALSESLREANRLVQSGKGVNKQVRLRSLARFVDDMALVGRTLGVFARTPTEYLRERRDLKARRIDLDVDAVEKLVAARDKARDGKDWAQADALRAEIEALGAKVQDGAKGSTWTL